MEKFDIYKDIAKRTGGDVYIGVVGPVRTGKSTFITRFMNLMVTPNISGKNKKMIAVDEMPQSADGKTITTTEPKFVPSEAVKISVKGKGQARVRLIDCVGYLVDGAIGSTENDEPRLVKTPWSDNPLPFEEAAATGTEKVIKDHSTIGILVTTDGSVSGIPRQNYEKAEEKVVRKLKEANKPFVIVLNSTNPESAECNEIAASLTDKYGVKVLPANVKEIDEDGLGEILESVLMEFPLKSLDIKLPEWMRTLPPSNETILNIIGAVKEISAVTEKMKDYKLIEDALSGVDGIKRVENATAYLGEGRAEYSVEPENDLFYKMLSQVAGESVSDERQLMSYVKELAVAKENYEKIKDALKEADEGGYGIVIPEETDMTLGAPEVIKQGGRYGVKLKAETSCMHLMKIRLDAEVSPISGSEKQCKDFADFLKNELDETPEKVWKTDVFGKPLSKLISEEMALKLSAMKNETKNKMRKTVTRIVNEGRGGVICILL